MDGYVEKLGDIGKDDFERKDLKDTVLKELGVHTENISQLTEQRKVTEAESTRCRRKATALFILLSVKETFTGVLLPLLDMGTDIATAATHFVASAYGWGSLTIIFVWLPGFVAAVAIAVRGLRKSFTFQRFINYLIIVFAFPFLYPLIQILVNCYMLYLMIINRSHEVIKIMGHDVKQFKSLEGFLESGPQFILQSYILLRGEKLGYEDLTSVEARRVFTLSVSVLLSFLSLAKTGYNVNKADPDPNRKAAQTKSNARFFTLTSVPFHLVCVLFRVSCLAYFFATFRYWTILVIFVGVGANICILEWVVGTSHTVSFLLGAVSLFMPNGYLLYNFAATFPVDFTFEGTRRFLLWHMAALTLSFLACITGVISAGLSDADWLANNVPADSVLNDYDVQTAMNVTLVVLGILSAAMCYVHWRVSIVPLYSHNTSENEGKGAEEAQEMRKDEEEGEDQL